MKEDAWKGVFRASIKDHTVNLLRTPTSDPT